MSVVFPSLPGGRMLKRRLEGNLDLLEQGRLDYAPGKDDLPTLLFSDGKIRGISSKANFQMPILH